MRFRTNGYGEQCARCPKKMKLESMGWSQSNERCLSCFSRLAKFRHEVVYRSTPPLTSGLSTPTYTFGDEHSKTLVALLIATYFAIMAPSNHQIKTIEERIQILPQELQDQILDSLLILTKRNLSFIWITPNYKPPWQLSLDHRTRRTQAYDYYVNTTFLYAGLSYVYQWHAFCRSIPAPYRAAAMRAGRQGPDSKVAARYRIVPGWNHS